MGLSYLTLDRPAPSLSGGEGQRIRLASQIGSELTGVIYVLDEPSIGLHQRDNKKLLAALKHLRDIGNTVVVVEHDQRGDGGGRLADRLRARRRPPRRRGRGGGHAGPGPQSKASLTGRYLRGDLRIEIPRERRGRRRARSASSAPARTT